MGRIEVLRCAAERLIEEALDKLLASSQRGMTKLQQALVDEDRRLVALSEAPAGCQEFSSQ